MESEATQAFQGRARFEGLDSLRGVAALAVLVSHVSLASGYDKALRGLTFRLHVGVPIFFAISGFVLYRPFLAARLRAGPTPDLRIYLLRRFTRIVPAYWLALTVLALWPGVDDVLSGHAWVYYGFLQVYRPVARSGGLIPAWTLCFEVLFYLLLPAFALWSARLARRGQLRADLLGLGALAAVAIAWRTLFFMQHQHHRGLFLWLPYDLDWFVPGMVLAALSVRGWRPLKPRWALASWGGAALAFLVLWLIAGYQFDSVLQSQLNAVVFAVLSFLLLAPAALGAEPGVVHRLLHNRTLLWLGGISYGIYLWHYPLAFAFHDQLGLGLIGTLVATLVVTIACATVSHYVLERPLMRRTRLYAERRKRIETDLPAAAADRRPVTVPEPASDPA